MKSKIESLKKEKDFKTVLSEGKRFTEKYLRAVIIDNGLKKLRLAIVASRKLGNAVVRNRIRRRIREASRAEMRGLSGDTGADVIIFPATAAKNAPFLEIRQAIGRIFSRTGLR